MTGSPASRGGRETGLGEAERGDGADIAIARTRVRARASERVFGDFGV